MYKTTLETSERPSNIKRCLCAQPVITPAEAGIDTSLTQTDEERATCLYVRAISDERVMATRCFGTLAPFPPPPPPMPRAIAAHIQTVLRRKKVKRGGSAGAEAAPELTEQQAYVKQHIERHQEVRSLLDRLSAENLVLRDVLEELRPKLLDSSVQGRRLFQRLPGTGSHHFEESIKTNELSVGGGALIGITNAECSTICAALTNSSDTFNSCNGIAYRMLEPGNLANLQTAYCFLLRNTGGCTPNDFAASIFSRRDTSGCHTPTREDNPMCVQLSPQVTNLRVLNYANARASCRQGKLLPRMIRPRSALEAFSAIGYARDRGAHAFWAEKPLPSQSRQLTHWSGMDGQPFYYPGSNDKRCILVATQSNNIHGYM